MSEADLEVWTVNSIVAVYNVDFKNYRDQLSKASEHFTVSGWNSFGTAFINSGNLQKLKDARLVGSAQPERAAVIVHKAIIGDRLTWEIQFPLLVSYENENETHTQHLMVTALVVRTIETDHPDGIAIEQVNAPPTAMTPVGTMSKEAPRRPTCRGCRGHPYGSGRSRRFVTCAFGQAQ